MKRVIVGEIMHESSTFARFPTEEENFRKTLMWYEGEEVWQLSKLGVKDYLSGIMEKGRELELDIKPSFCAFASPSGRISKNCFHTLKDKFFENIDPNQTIDGFCLALHGAGVAEDAEDLEGAFLEELRRRFGPDVPVVVTLDPHANITERMAELADVLIPSKLYPHTDTYEAGEKAITLLSHMMKQTVKPVMVVQKLPLLIPITKGCTGESPMKEILEVFEKAEKRDRILDCTFVHGFPYSDIRECGAAVVVTSDGEYAAAADLAKEMASLVYGQRSRFLSDFPDVETGLDLAERWLREQHGLIVMNEASDNPGAGTPGDGTFLLRELLKRNIPKSCAGAIVDPETVQAAVSAGVGTEISIRLGGKTDALHGESIELDGVYVKAVADGKYSILSPMTHGQPVNFGTSVRLQKGNVDIVVASNGFQIMDDGLFTMLGINVREYNLAAVKSAQHFKAYFSHLTDRIITVDPPGISTGMLNHLPYSRVRRPVYPLDEC